jgi:hypothetical protein
MRDEDLSVNYLIIMNFILYYTEQNIASIFVYTFWTQAWVPIILNYLYLPKLQIQAKVG